LLPRVSSSFPEGAFTLLELGSHVSDVWIQATISNKQALNPLLLSAKLGPGTYFI
jgi:hypothetical protein